MMARQDNRAQFLAFLACFVALAGLVDAAPTSNPDEIAKSQ